MPACRLSGAMDLLALHARTPSRWPMLLESAAFEPQRGRHDVLLGFVQDGLQLHADGVTRDLDGKPRSGAFMDLLDAAVHGHAAPAPVDGPPCWPGWGVFVGYELAGLIEPSLRLPSPPEPLPMALALRCAVAVVVDRLNDCTWLLVDDRIEHAQALLEAARAEVEAARAAAFEPLSAPVVLASEEDPAEHYQAAVAKALEYIAAGDVFQINLSRRWKVHLAHGTSAASLFAALRQANPAPFAALLAWDDWAIVSSSPERLVSVQSDAIETRPIAGTRPRLQGEDEAARIRELIGHPKERAEHVMLIDLERNDLGRICEAGSVEVNELMVVESYAHVHHIVSNVRGRLRAGTTPGAVLRAVFPGGSITGCPKVRCMQLIAELEGEGRGAYTGALGWIGHNGAMDLNILIRSLSVHRDQASFRAGAGIVADSQPDSELAETRAKARGLLRALGLPD